MNPIAEPISPTSSVTGIFIVRLRNGALVSFYPAGRWSIEIGLNAEGDKFFSESAAQEAIDQAVNLRFYNPEIVPAL